MRNIIIKILKLDIKFKQIKIELTELHRKIDFLEKEIIKLNNLNKK